MEENPKSYICNIKQYFDFYLMPDFQIKCKLKNAEKYKNSSSNSKHIYSGNKYCTIPELLISDAVGDQQPHPVFAHPTHPNEIHYIARDLLVDLFLFQTDRNLNSCQSRSMLLLVSLILVSFFLLAPHP